LQDRGGGAIAAREADHTRGRTRLRVTALAVLSLAGGLAAGLLLAEVAVRVAGMDLPLLRRSLERMVVDLSTARPSADPVVCYELLPGSSAVYPAVHPTCGIGSGTYRVSVGPLGERAPAHDAAKPPGVFRIAVVGASSTYGACVDDGQTMPAALERVLNRLAAEAGEEAPRFEVLNVSAGAWQVAQMARTARRLLAERQPDLLVLQDREDLRRAFLGTPEALAAIDVAALSDDPLTLEENFPSVVLPAAAHRWLFRVSALYRAVVGAVRARWPSWRDQEARGHAAGRVRNDRELRELAALASAAGVRVHVFGPPVEGRQGGGPGRVMPLLARWRIEGLPGVTGSTLSVASADPAATRSHPPPWALEEWAEDLADDLRVLGLVPLPPPAASVQAPDPGS